MGFVWDLQGWVKGKTGKKDTKEGTVKVNLLQIKPSSYYWKFDLIGSIDLPLATNFTFAN